MMIISKEVQKVPAFYGTQMFTTVFTKEWVSSRFPTINTVCTSLMWSGMDGIGRSGTTHSLV